MKKVLLSLLCAAACGFTPMQADELYYEQGFDNSADFADGAGVPTGWLSEGTYALSRQVATDLGVPAKSGSYIIGNVGSYMQNRDEVLYTPTFALRGGKPCTVSFWLYAPGGTPAIVRYTQIAVTAGTAQNAAAQTTTLGTTPEQVHADWTQYTFTYTPEADGEYCFAFHVNTKMAQCGTVALDDITIEGESPAAVVPGEFSALADALADGFDTTPVYTYKGEVVVSHFDAAAGTAYVQDATGAACISLPAGTTVATGDRLTDVKCSVAVDGKALTLTVPADAAPFTVVSQGNALPAQPVTPAALAAAPADYVNRLVSVDGVWVKDAEPGDVFEEDIDYVLTDQTTEIALHFFADGDLYYEEAPTEKLKVTGIVTSATTAELAPRSMADLEKYKEAIVHETQEMPYQQSFDNENGDYDGSSQLPMGWAATGSLPFVTANMNSLAAVTGTYYMVTTESTVARDERTYTPFFDMEAGQEYIFSFYLYMPGNSTGGVLQSTDLSVTVGNEQEAAAQTTELLKIEGTSLPRWTFQSVSFTPMVSGQYCFALNLSSAAAYCGDVAVDDVTVRAANGIMRPTADFSISTWYDIFENRLVVFDNEPVKLTNLSTEATEYEWSVPGAVPETSTEKHPNFQFPTAGTYEVTLKVKNSKYEKSTVKEIQVFKPNDNELVGLMNYNPADDKLLSFYDVMPTYATDPEFDYVSGPNHYYRRLAQRYSVRAPKYLTISDISTWLVAYSRMSSYTAEERNHPFTIAFYGEKDGRLDESVCFGRKVSTMTAEFGDVGIGYEHPKMWGFSLSDNPITVYGNFYVAFEFDKNFPIDSPDPNVTRSYVAFGLARSKAGSTGIYVQPTAGPEGFTPDGGWYSVDKVDADQAGLNLNLTLWATPTPGAPDGIVAIGTDGTVKFDARVSDNRLHVSGTQAGERIVLFDAAGRAVRTVIAEENSTQVALGDLPAGNYIVTGRSGAVKVLKK